MLCISLTCFSSSCTVQGLMCRQFDVHCKCCAEKGCWLCRLMCVGYGLRTLEVRLAMCKTCILSDR